MCLRPIEQSAVRGIPSAQPAISPSTFTDLHTAADFRRFGDRVRELTDGIPIGMKLSANHIEADMCFALDAGVDHIILDGRSGGTGAAPRYFAITSAFQRSQPWDDKMARLSGVRYSGYSS